MENVGNAINQLVELIDDEPGFRIKKITVEREIEFNQERWVVAAFNENGEPFQYAMYITHWGQIIADGY